MKYPQIFAVICCLTFTVGVLSSRRQNANTDNKQERENDLEVSVEKRGPMSYVVDRGCPYLTHYVRKNYFSFFDNRPASVEVTTTISSNTNWVQLVYDAFVESYVPIELFHGLVNCGKHYALYAVNPSDSVISALKANFTIIPGVGK